MRFLSHLGGESLYRSLENIQASIEMSRKKQLNKAAAMVEYKVGRVGADRVGAERVGAEWWGLWADYWMGRTCSVFVPDGRKSYEWPHGPPGFAPSVAH